MAESARSVDVTTVHEWRDGEVHRALDYLVAEEPLEIRVNGSPLTVTMRTPGNDLELAAGFLFTEGIIAECGQIAHLKHSQAQPNSKNIVEIQLTAEVEFDTGSQQRNFFVASSCGICGKTSIDAVRRRGIRAPNPDFSFPSEILCRLPDQLRTAQGVFERTGGLHGAALFDCEGKLIEVREDVGRHNAVDKLIGWAILNHQRLDNTLMLVSGRGGFEIVQKALAAGVPLLASVSAPSSLAVQLARQMQLTLVGFLRGSRFVVYAGEERLSPAGSGAVRKLREVSCAKSGGQVRRLV
jgi:FdhD protein